MKVSKILNKNNSLRLESLARFRKSLNTSRALQETKLAEGVQGINRLVEDVEGDWLKNWSDDGE